MSDTARTHHQLAIAIFADGADIEGLRALAALPHIAGFTTNPTLMRKAGVADYKRFAHEALEVVDGRPISFEVFSDEPSEMLAQGREIATWGTNVFVKVPVTTTRGESTAAIVRELSQSGVQVNVTALMTLAQVTEMTAALQGGAASNISVFAGRIADTGRDPIPLMQEALSTMEAAPSSSLIWASPREVLNIVQADEIGCHIITVTYDLLAKLDGLAKPLGQFSLETVQMFHRDAAAAGFTIDTPQG
jgi:transaldolase